MIRQRYFLLPEPISIEEKHPPLLRICKSFPAAFAVFAFSLQFRKSDSVGGRQYDVRKLTNSTYESPG